MGFGVPALHPVSPPFLTAAAAATTTAAATTAAAAAATITTNTIAFPQGPGPNPSLRTRVWGLSVYYTSSACGIPLCSAPAPGPGVLACMRCRLCGAPEFMHCVTAALRQAG
jgi:hypothetical protein